MKNLFKLSLVSGLFLASTVISSQALQVTQTIPVGGFTNLITTFNNAPIKVTQIIVVTPTATNTSGLLIDTPTNQLTFISPAYTNIVSYATNYVSNLTGSGTPYAGYTYLAQWTNYYGVVQSISTNLSTAGVAVTNLFLVDATNIVAASTNLYPARVGVGAAYNNNPAVFSGVNYYFQQGCWFTNTSTGTAQITLIYQE